MNTKNMNTIEIETVIETAPETKELMVVANETGIQKEAAESLLGLFSANAKKARELVLQSQNITDPKLARACRLSLREVRVEIENTRKKAKEDSLRMGKAIDGMANVLKFIIEPAEQRLSDCERAEEIAAEKRRAELKQLRESQLAPFGIDPAFYSLGIMPEETFQQLLENTKAAHQAKIEAAKKAEEDRIKAENERLKEEARIRAENEKLKQEAAIREALLKQEREAAEAAAKLAAEKAAKERAEIEAKSRAERAEAEKKAKQEREAREKLEAENRARIAAEEAKAKAEAESKAKAERAPDKEKILAWRNSIKGLETPQAETKQGRSAIANLMNRIADLDNAFQREIEAL